MSEFIGKVAETEAELKEYFAIRHMVFVDEQRMFEGTDRDEHDEHSIHLVALDKNTGRVVGAVRCYEADKDVWYGGRLAVHPNYRKGTIGRQLCELAEATVIEQGCEQFLAYIQLQNVPFFKRLNWSPIGEPVLYHGQPHQLMAASLAAVAHRKVKEYADSNHA
ncbi:MAG: GNAT family N-acetyltransferase [Chloroflexi bacterium]|nr:GNAT family N-acetyltransferase [Chloroflexota bacterium]